MDASEPLSLETLPMLLLPEAGDASREGAACQGLLEPAVRRYLERDILPLYLAQKRWFAGKDSRIGAVELQALGIWQPQAECWLMTLAHVRGGEGSRASYFVPMAIRWGAGDDLTADELSRVISRIRRGTAIGLLLEAEADDRFSHDLVRAMGRGLAVPMSGGTLAFTPTRGYHDCVPESLDMPVHRPRLEQSNTSQVLGNKLVLKFYRKTEPGISPEWEIGRFLTDIAGFRHAAPMLGGMEWRPEGGEPVLMAVLQAYVENQGSAWDYVLRYLADFLEKSRSAVHDEGKSVAQAFAHDSFLARMTTLGERTGEMHRALAMSSPGQAFGTEALQAGEAEGWARQVLDDLHRTLDLLSAARARLAEPLRARVEGLLARRDRLAEIIAGLIPVGLDAMKSRYHGDYHLGQVLVSGQDFVIIDFEGEPGRPLSERRRHGSPLKDVAGMLRSFDYAAATAAASVRSEPPAARARAEELLHAWRRETEAAFLEGYRIGIGDCPAYPREAEHAEMLIRLFGLEKVLYELRYELANRPDWVGIPLGGIIRMTGESS